MGKGVRVKVGSGLEYMGKGVRVGVRVGVGVPDKKGPVKSWSTMLKELGLNYLGRGLG